MSHLIVYCHLLCDTMIFWCNAAIFFPILQQKEEEEAFSHLVKKKNHQQLVSKWR